jgi:hypothetical protein
MLGSDACEWASRTMLGMFRSLAPPTGVDPKCNPAAPASSSRLIRASVGGWCLSGSDTRASRSRLTPTATCSLGCKGKQRRRSTRCFLRARSAMPSVALLERVNV